MKPVYLIFCLFTATNLLAQNSYWQQHVTYTIQAELNDQEKSISATETLVYKNNSPDTLTFIWFHIWPNAYANDSTALIKQILKDPELEKGADKRGRGSIEGLSFKINNEAARTEPHPNKEYIDIIKLVLNQPLLPGGSISISTPFKVTLPPYFSRSGHQDGEFMFCQWYPKPAVYDKDGWHEFPYLDIGEFYSEFGDFNVTLVVPAAYVVGATGTLDTKEESDKYKKIGKRNASKRNKKPKLYKGGASEKKTLVYRAQQVPDFAWFADKNFVIEYDTLRLPSGKVVDAFSYFHKKKKTVWTNSIDYVKDGARKYSKWVGEYEYPTVQAVEGPGNNSSGGMEYPMITLITSPNATIETLDGVIAHEVGHNWFMSMLGSNERAHTWMDEGLNTYYQFRYEAEKYRANSMFGEIPPDIRKLDVKQFQAAIYNAVQSNVPMESAMDIPADQFANSLEYGMVSYLKTALWMYILESNIGREKLDAAMHNYFLKWKNKHPQPEDLKAAFEESTGLDLTRFFELTKKPGKF